MLEGLNFVVLHVPDLAQASTFYTEKLGFTVEAQQPGFVQFSQPGSGATLSIASPSDNPTYTEQDVELWWYVDDADATCARLRDRGAEIVDPPHDEPFGRAFSVKDPAGHVLYMLQPPSRS